MASEPSIRRSSSRVVGRSDPLLGFHIDQLGRFERATNGDATYEGENCRNQRTRAEGGEVSSSTLDYISFADYTDRSGYVSHRYELGIDTIDAVSIDPGRSAESLGHLPPQKDADGNPL